MNNYLQELLKGVELICEVKVKEKTRKLGHVNARYIFCYIAHKNLKNNYSQIGRFLDLNHATVINYVNKFEFTLKSDKHLTTLYKQTLGYMTKAIPEIDKRERRVVKAQIKYHESMIKSLKPLLNA